MHIRRLKGGEFQKLQEGEWVPATKEEVDAWSDDNDKRFEKTREADRAAHRWRCKWQFDHRTKVYRTMPSGGRLCLKCGVIIGKLYTRDERTRRYREIYEGSCVPRKVSGPPASPEVQSVTPQSGIALDAEGRGENG